MALFHILQFWGHPVSRYQEFFWAEQHLQVPFLKPRKQLRFKKIFPCEWFDSVEKLENAELPQYVAYVKKLRNKNPPDKDLKDY